MTIATSKIMKRLIVSLASIAALGTGLYWLGHTRGVRQMRGDFQEAATEVVACERSLDELRREGDETRVRMRRLEARLRLQMALEALDDRNFGIAQEHVAAAGELLADTIEQSNSVDALLEAIERTQLVATEDLDSQRATVLGFSKRLDRVIQTAPSS